MSASVPALRLQRALCILVIAVIAASVLYAAYVGISNFSHIHV